MANPPEIIQWQVAGDSREQVVQVDQLDADTQRRTIELHIGTANVTVEQTLHKTTDGVELVDTVRQGNLTTEICSADAGGRRTYYGGNVPLARKIWRGPFVISAPGSSADDRLAAYGGVSFQQGLDDLSTADARYVGPVVRGHQYLCGVVDQGPFMTATLVSTAPETTGTGTQSERIIEARTVTFGTENNAIPTRGDAVRTYHYNSQGLMERVEAVGSDGQITTTHYNNLRQVQSMDGNMVPAVDMHLTLPDGTVTHATFDQLLANMDPVKLATVFNAGTDFTQIRDSHNILTGLVQTVNMPGGATAKYQRFLPVTELATNPPFNVDTLLVTNNVVDQSGGLLAFTAEDLRGLGVTPGHALDIVRPMVSKQHQANLQVGNANYRPTLVTARQELVRDMATYLATNQSAGATGMFYENLIALCDLALVP
jgi:hypothetical protein